MKKIYLICFIFLSFHAYSQYQGPNSPNIVTQQFFACLSCPGEEWVSTNNVKVSDSIYARVPMTAYPSCFQSSCHYARNLIATGFGFNIPGNAVISGIKADIQRKAGAPLSVVDTIVQLMKRDTVNGSNKAFNLSWPTANTVISYGDSTDLWGTTWLASDINDSLFGITIKPSNRGNDSTSAYIDHMQITVYYTIPNGFSSISPVFNYVNVMTEAGSKNIVVSFANEKPLTYYTLEVFNSTGQCIVKQEHPNSAGGGMHRETISNSGWANGLYIVRMISPEGTFSRKILIAN